MKTKTNMLLSKCLLKIAIKTKVFRKPERRDRALLTAKLTRQTMKRQLSKIISVFATSDSEFIYVTEDEEINANVAIDSYPQKSQPEIKEGLNIVLVENNIRSQNIKTIPFDRTNASKTKFGKNSHSKKGQKKYPQ